MAHVNLFLDADLLDDLQAAYSENYTMGVDTEDNQGGIVTVYFCPDKPQTLELEQHERL